MNWSEAEIDALFAPLNSEHLPGVTVGIAIEGVPVYRKGFGLANMDLDVVLTPGMRMRIASTTKHFTSLAWMLLCEDGLAALDAPMSTYLPQLSETVGKATPRQLMTHTSGLRDVHDLFWSFSGSDRRLSSEAFLDTYERLTSLNFEPNTRWMYNNGGYLLLSKAIEQVSGIPLEAFFRDRIFAPIGMNDTLLRRWESDFVPNSAALHTGKPGGGYWKHYNGSELMGEGGIASTIDDMLRWSAHMDRPVVGNAATWATMKTPQILKNGASTCYGLGLFVDRYRGVETIHHAGGLLGGNSHLIKLPAHGVDIIVLSNRFDVSAAELAYDIIDQIVSGLEQVDKSNAACASGRFLSAKSGRLIELDAIEGRQSASIDGFEMPCAWDSEGRLRPSGKMRYFKHWITRVGNDQAPQLVSLHESGEVDQFHRISEDVHHVSPLPTGCYVQPETGMRATVLGGDDGLEVWSGMEGIRFTLSAVAEGCWLSKSDTPLPFGGIIRLDPSGEGFLYSTGRTRDLLFRYAGQAGK